MNPPPPLQGHIRIVSYNVRKCIGLDRRRSPERTLGVITDLSPDIVVLQEADKRLGRRPSAIPKRLLRKHCDLTPVRLGVNRVSLGWHGNAILVREGVDVTGHARIDVPSLEPRGVVMTELEIDSRTLRIIGVHLGLIRRYRKQQLAALVRHLADLAPMPTIIAGDFNEWSPRRGLEPLHADFELYSPGRTYHASRPVAPLDRFALGQGVSMRDCHVQKFGAARRASDHLPIWADVELD